MSELEQDEGLLKRWSRRKAAVVSGAVVEDEPQALVEEPSEPESLDAEPAPPPLSDEDMPPLESLNEESDYTGFLSPNVSDALRKQALRKLFSSAVFNKVDGLDDYDEDFTQFEALGDIITSDMKFEAEQRARRELEAMMDDEEVEDEFEDDALVAAQSEPEAELDDVSEDVESETSLDEVIQANDNESGEQT